MHITKKVWWLTFILSGLVALHTGIMIIQNTETVRRFIGHYIHQCMLSGAGCDFQTDVVACQLFPLSITCRDTRVLPLRDILDNRQPPWYWQCKTLTFHFSWFGILFLNKLISSIEATDLTLYSRIEQQQLSIGPHLQKILLGNILRLPMSLKTVKVTHGTFTVHDPERALTALIEFAGLSKKNKQQFKSVWYFTNGTLFYHNNAYIEHVSGTMHNIFTQKVHTESSLKASGFVRVFPTRKDLVYLTATGNAQGWTVHLNNQERELIADIHVTKDNITITATNISDMLNDTITLAACISSPQHAQGTITAATIPLNCMWNYQADAFTATISATNTNNIPLCIIKKRGSQDAISVSGTFVYDQIKNIIPPQWRSIIAGGGTVDYHGTIGWPLSELTFTTKNSCLTNDTSSNICRTLHAHVVIDHQARHITLNNFTSSWYQGTITCPQAHLYFDDQWHILHAHIPLTINNCLINWYDNTSRCSGSVLLSCTHNTPRLDARLILDDTYLSNGFIAQLQQKSDGQTAAPGLTTHCHLETRTPAHIYMPTLHAKADINLSIDGPIATPHVSGVLQLHKGTISFPSCNFAITDGMLQLDPANSENSLVELTAKTTIQQHQITLQIFGTLTNPDIRLSSTPTLSQQHIVALLLTGSPEIALNTALPTLITEQLKQLIIAKKFSTAPPSLIDHIIQQLRHIKLTPKLTDATGGGISGGIEVDFNERLHAKVQQDFKTAEALALELDYQLSDELSLKAFKDEQGHIGGQASVCFTW
jgi:hypothetical protein